MRQGHCRWVRPARMPRQTGRRNRAASARQYVSENAAYKNSFSHSSGVWSKFDFATLAGSKEKPESGITFFKQDSLEGQTVAGDRVDCRALEQAVRRRYAQVQRIAAVVDNFVVHSPRHRIRER